MVQSNRLQLHTLTSSTKINFSRYRIKRYTHFDNKISIDNVQNDITNRNWVAKHGFYPFIHFKIKHFKYSRKTNEKKLKNRDIYFASHIDSYIFKYYGDLLNHQYNNQVEKVGINKIATAYRNNLDGKSNIHFSKEVIDFIKKQRHAFIYVADFTNFFDELDHKYLKSQIKVVLNDSNLPKDYYAVFKNITKFSWAEKGKIDAVLKKKYKNRVKKKKLTRLFDEKGFRKFRDADNDNIQYNKKSYGIPQGAGLSSVCSNIYLLDFDKRINDYVQSNNGLYRRYCDDLIIVIPFDEDIGTYEYSAHIKIVEKIKNEIPRLQIQKEKTNTFMYYDGNIVDEKLKPTRLDYLGFTFDGINVRIREKSLFKFYSRAYKKVRLCNRKSIDHNRKKHRKKLYSLYTHLGKRQSKYGNFLTYASRAQQVFDGSSETNNLMEAQVSNHWKYIHKRF